MQSYGTRCAAGGDGLVDVDVAHSIQRQRIVGAPTHRIVDKDVAVGAGCTID